MSKPEYFIGLMSGTSVDAIDAVIVAFQRDAISLVASHSVSIPNKLRQELIALTVPGKNEIHRAMSADRQLAELYAKAVNQLLEQSGTAAQQIVAIGCHGQTIRHSPTTKPAYSLQIGDPNTLCELTGIRVVADFRRRDIAAGGEAAPYAPAFHEYLFRVSNEARLVINLGGIANLTLLSANQNEPVTGFDTGPSNILMDSWIMAKQKKRFDKNGHWGASGKVDDALLEQMLSDPYFKRRPPKSTGREYFNLDWLGAQLKRHKKRMQHKNVQATLCELTARSITAAIQKHAPDYQLALVCGGGVHNMALMFRLQSLLDHCQVRSTEDYGVDPDLLEAMCFAWLARRTLNGETGNLPSVTNAQHAAILGGIYQP